MARINSVSIVLVGQSLPIAQIRSDDFKFDGFTVTEKVRLPIVLELEAGPFGVVAAVDRCQIHARSADPDQNTLQVLMDNATSVIELVGRRVVTSVGINLDGEIADRRVVRKIHQTILSDFWAGELGLRQRDACEAVSFFDSEDATWGRLHFGVPPEADRVVVSMNFHFDLTTNPTTPRAQNAITRCPAKFDEGKALLAKITNSLELAEASQ